MNLLQQMLEDQNVLKPFNMANPAHCSIQLNRLENKIDQFAIALAHLANAVNALAAEDPK